VALVILVPISIIIYLCVGDTQTHM